MNTNEAVSLNCSVVQGAPASTITWSKEGRGKKGQWIFSLESESIPGLWSSLRINNVSAENAGKYKCVVKKDKHEDVCEEYLHVNCKFMSRCFENNQVQVKVLGNVGCPILIGSFRSLKLI